MVGLQDSKVTKYMSVCARGEALVGAFKLDMALIGAFSVIVKFSGNLREPSFKALAEADGVTEQGEDSAVATMTAAIQLYLWKLQRWNKLKIN